MNEKEKALYSEVSKILWNEWDPIGVNDSGDENNDEYDAYVPEIYKLAMEDKDAEVIANHLSSIEKERMELEPVEKHSKNTASLIIAAREKIIS